MTGIIDYGVGNLFSLQASLKYLGDDAVVTRELEQIRKADRLILPGVGAFGQAMEKLASTGLVPVLRETKKPLLGICLGMQMLFDTSLEYGEHQGLGLLRGCVIPLSEQDACRGLKVPHMGWNALSLRRQEHPLLRYTAPGSYMYFVHSYYASDCEDSLLATAEYGVEVPALVGAGNVMGAQFHPEKSGQAGLDLLRAFLEMEA